MPPATSLVCLFKLFEKMGQGSARMTKFSLRFWRTGFSDLLNYRKEGRRKGKGSSKSYYYFQLPFSDEGTEVHLISPIRIKTMYGKKLQGTKSHSRRANWWWWCLYHYSWYSQIERFPEIFGNLPIPLGILAHPGPIFLGLRAVHSAVFAHFQCSVC